MTEIKIEPKEPPEETLVERLRKRAEIRRQIPTRKSVQENKPDRVADLLEEAATKIEADAKTISDLENCIGAMDDIIDRIEQRLSRYKEELSKSEEYEAMYKDLCK